MAFQLPSWVFREGGRLLPKYSSKQPTTRRWVNELEVAKLCPLEKPEDPPPFGCRLEVVFLGEENSGNNTAWASHSPLQLGGEFLEVSFSSDLFFSHFGWFGGKGWLATRKDLDRFIYLFFFGGLLKNVALIIIVGLFFFSPDLVMLPQAYDVPEIKFFVMDSWTTDFRFSPLDSSLKMHFFS